MERHAEAEEIVESADVVDMEEETVSDKEVAEGPIDSMESDEESWITVKLPKQIMESTAVCQNADRHELSHHHQVFATVTTVIPYSSGNFENFVPSPSTSRKESVRLREPLHGNQMSSQ